MREDSIVKKTTYIVLSFIVALLLTIIPLPMGARWYRPEWVFLVLCFWLYRQPDRVGIIWAFVLGLLVDLLSGSLLGQHAFLFTLTAYLAIKLHTRRHLAPFLQETAILAVLLVIYFALQYWIMTMVGVVLESWHYWLPIITSVIVWPFIYAILQAYQRRFSLS